MSDFLKASHASRISLIGLCCLACAIPLFATRGQPASRPGKIASISDLQCNDMKLHHVLNLDAPVGCDRLSLVSFDYVGYDGQIHHDGEIVVMDVAADYVLQIFATLRQHSFPIAKSRPMDSYDGDDNASMADNNTSAFNDRQIAGGGTLSLHAYGLAIDLNPLQNPPLLSTECLHHYLASAAGAARGNPPAPLHFMGRMASQYSRPTIRLSPALIEACLRYPWPGNLRELENFVKRYLVMGDEATAIAELRANWRPSQIAVDASSGPTTANLESVPVNGEGPGNSGQIDSARVER